MYETLSRNVLPCSLHLESRQPNQGAGRRLPAPWPNEEKVPRFTLLEASVCSDRALMSEFPSCEPVWILWEVEANL